MDKKAAIATGLAAGLNTREIGELIGGVSRQRVYQLMTEYGLRTPERKRKGYWRDQEPRLQWLNRTLGRNMGRGNHLDSVTRQEIIAELADKLPDVCPVFGIPLVYGNKNLRCDNSASVDRLDSTKPYCKGNVNIVSFRANRIKNDGTLAELKQLVAWLESLDTTTSL
jgi:hypothetical protein